MKAVQSGKDSVGSTTLYRQRQVKLDADDVTRICRLVVDRDLDTQYVADRFAISRRRAQLHAKEYRDTGEIPTIHTPGRKPYAEFPTDLVEWILELYGFLEYYNHHRPH